MFRKIVLGLFVVAATAGLASVSSANPISRNNPYRSFNISGINYGSLNWERSHGNRSSRSVRSGSGMFRVR
jgi:hypothetical protein